MVLAPPHPPEKAENMIIAPIMAAFRPKMSLSFVHIMMKPSSVSEYHPPKKWNVIAIRKMAVNRHQRTGVGDQITGNNPIRLLKTM